MEFLVVTRRHSLMPFAWRLKREGHKVEILVQDKRFQKAWEGRLDKLEVPEGTRDEELVEMLKASDQTILTDMPHMTDLLGGRANVFGSLAERGDPYTNPMLGGWWDGENFLSRHLWLEEPGLWAGGMGSQQPGAGLLVRLWNGTLDEPFLQLGDALKSAGFVGLVQASLVSNDGEVGIGRWKAGWPWLHTHAFLSALEGNFADVLEGMEDPLRKTYTLVVPVSVPPWPYRDPATSWATVRPVDLGGPELRGEITSSVFFHDVRISPEGDVTTAGLDGLVGVVRGEGNTLTSARARAFGVLQHIRIPEIQYRTDAGTASDNLLVLLESFGLV